MPVAYYSYFPLNFKLVTSRVVSDKELGVPMSKVQQGELTIRVLCFVYIEA